MAIDKLFDSFSSVMTVVSFLTFIGILWWTFSRRDSDFDSAAMLPFADESAGQAHQEQQERGHV
ncbi:cbb3-type cytochrome oxidase subunit 3 [Janthinobacterium agaricidamnosum]|uniref:Cbb3-type cytochrome oxidase component FixQ family protein n=1 Tax=Janthinobacterium agaricidamnosum NBRC 102515 = DSM 9628 TaxID=1349767 RepID=W0VDN9_9BURK|nr:CcoQ/FixQ family Cbb3-type cytochrome c oxidase assembly chaperone [Janthinobacterium agaricidamnosum]CDG86031.1 cbb3-type cytochrome oxidase component FixQ family protein [Janthinobacterium agaricidamnosum NBRC 102515 = DSM 9628]